MKEIPRDFEEYEGREDKREGKEKPPGREIDVYLFRHGEAQGEGVGAELTEKGRGQAREAGRKLFTQIKESGGGVIKLFRSPLRRAEQTAEIMQATIAEMLTEQEEGNIRLMKERDREALRAPGVIGPLRKQGIEDPIEYWLRNPQILEGKNPEIVAERLKRLLNRLKKIADRLPPGEKVYYICVTHEVPQAALLNQLTGKTLNELGGGIENCESTLVQIKGKKEEPLRIIFRDKQLELRIP